MPPVYLKNEQEKIRQYDQLVRTCNLQLEWDVLQQYSTRDLQQSLQREEMSPMPFMSGKIIPATECPINLQLATSTV